MIAIGNKTCPRRNYKVRLNCISVKFKFIIICITKLCRQASTTRKQMHLGTLPPTRGAEYHVSLQVQAFVISDCPTSPLQVDQQNFHRNGNEEMTVGIVIMIVVVLL